MATKQARKLAGARTSFARWRIQCGLTIAEAAEKLHISPRQASVYEAGKSQHTGEPVSPPFCVRVTMMAIATGQDVTAWPE